MLERLAAAAVGALARACWRQFSWHAVSAPCLPLLSHLGPAAPAAALEAVAGRSRGSTLPYPAHFSATAQFVVYQRLN